MSDAVIYEKDIISELAVSVICNLNELRYRINVFGDPKHPLSILLTTLFELKEVELDCGNTMDEVEQIEAKYEFASELINRLRDSYGFDSFIAETKLNPHRSIDHSATTDELKVSNFARSIEKAVKNYISANDIRYDDLKAPMIVLDDMLYRLDFDITTANYAEGKLSIILAKLEFTRDFVRNLQRSSKVPELTIPTAELSESALKSDYLLQRDVNEDAEELFGVFTPLVVAILHCECMHRIYTRSPIVVLRQVIQKIRRSLLCRDFTFGEMYYIREKLKTAAEMYNYMRYRICGSKTDFDFYLMMCEDEVAEAAKELPQPSADTLDIKFSRLLIMLEPIISKLRGSDTVDEYIIEALNQQFLAMMFDFEDETNAEIEPLKLQAKLEFAEEYLCELTGQIEEPEKMDFESIQMDEESSTSEGKGDTDYFVTLEKEIMNEYAASLEANIIKYEIKMGIEDNSDPIEILHHMVHELKDSLIGNDYTMDELKLIQAKFEFVRFYISDVLRARGMELVGWTKTSEEKRSLNTPADYFITLEKEVLSEVAASIEASIINYMVAHNIKGENATNPIVILLHNVHCLKDNLIGYDYTMDELRLLQAKLIFARDFINKVEELNGME